MKKKSFQAYLFELNSSNKNVGIPQHVLSTGRVTAVLATAHFTQVY
jgi:hypothetical protein